MQINTATQIMKTQINTDNECLNIDAKKMNTDFFISVYHIFIFAELTLICVYPVFTIAWLAFICVHHVF